MNVKIEPFLPSDGILLSGDRTKAEQANFNQSAGPAFTLFLDGKMLAAGGVRLGVGEAWFLLPESVRTQLAQPEYDEQKRIIIESCKAKMEEICRTEHLYRIYAEARTGARFCEAMGFEKRENLYLRG